MEVVPLLLAPIVAASDELPRRLRLFKPRIKHASSAMSALSPGIKRI